MPLIPSLSLGVSRAGAQKDINIAGGGNFVDLVLIAILLGLLAVVYGFVTSRQVLGAVFAAREDASGLDDQVIELALASQLAHLYQQIFA